MIEQYPDDISERITSLRKRRLRLILISAAAYAAFVAGPFVISGARLVYGWF